MNEQLDRIEMKLAELEGKLDEVGEMTRTLRRNAQIVFWITVGVIVLPLILIPLVIPAFLASLSGAALGF